MGMTLINRGMDEKWILIKSMDLSATNTTVFNALDVHENKLKNKKQREHDLKNPRGVTGDATRDV